MIHIIYLVLFALFVGIAFAVFSSGDARTKVKYGLKVFLQFVLISLALAWILYFIPW